MEKQRRKGNRLPCGVLFLLLVMIPALCAQAAGDDVCARVKIEIQQELTFERQGFDAHMRITNGLAGISLENVRVAVSFADGEGNPVPAGADPDDSGALFFIRSDGMQNIDDVDGGGTLAPASTADIHWLIIPAPGASNGLESGKMYYVGATLSYTINGQAHSTEVSPDYIFVKPLPLLSLDYFLPDEVFADDAFTTAVEPPVPFSVGVRVNNGGAGVARNLKIDSAQPRIVENEQGLLINFVIDASTVGGRPAHDSLLVDFGDVAPGAAATARWVMHCTLSGRFVEFSAEFSHAGELGGQLTSLIEAVNTHFLVRDVLVDLPGRDGIRDFLARDGGVLRVYESQNTETEVTDQSDAATLHYLDPDGAGIRYTLDTAPTAGLLYVRLPDPHQGGKIITAAVRSDGKRIRPENVWLSKTRDGQSWKYFVNLFDANGTGRYTLTFDDPASLPRAPVLQFVPDKSRVEEERLSFLVTASDPDGTVPVLSAGPLPAGARFTDQGDGQGAFDWTPARGQAGTYVVRFTASDGTFSDAQSVGITVHPADDSDGDGLDDNWERKYFGSLDRDGSGDFDGDGFADLEEYRSGTDPTRENHAPTVPVLSGPQDGGRVTTVSPLLAVVNSSDADEDALTYEFEVFSDDTLRTRVAAQAGVIPGSRTTAWQVPVSLADNHRYTWRVRASDGCARSLWAYGTFFVDTANDDPAAPQPAFPVPDSHVCTARPVLQVANTADADGDELTCAFEVYTDSSLSTPVAASPPIVQAGGGGTAWQVDTDLADASWYTWRVKVLDGRGGVSFSPPVAFYVDLSNRAPQPPAVLSPAAGAVVPAGQLDLAVANSTDPDGDMLTYRFELDSVSTFDSGARQVSEAVAEGADTTAWQVSGLAENTRYYWRVRASDGNCGSPWQEGTFFASSVNDVPLVPVARNPGEHAWAATLSPILEVAPGVDADQESLSYEFEIYTDEALTDLTDYGRSDSVQWKVPSALADKTRYFWRARAVDRQGAAGPWMIPIPVFIKAADSEPAVHVSVQVISDSGTPLARVLVRAFTESGHRTGRRLRTDKTGTALFKTAFFADGGYVFRADYCGMQFWSDLLRLPYDNSLTVVIPLQPVALTVRSEAGPVGGAKVKLYSPDGSYLRVHTRTDKEGRAILRLPAGTFRFKVKKRRRRFWSEPFTVSPGESSQVQMNLGAVGSAKRSKRGGKKNGAGD